MDKHTENVMSAYKSAYEICLKCAYSIENAECLFDNFKLRVQTAKDIGAITFIEYMKYVKDAQDKLNSALENFK